MVRSSLAGAVVLAWCGAVAALAQPQREMSVVPLEWLANAPKDRPADLAERLAAAARAPLGSQQNPVRVFEPAGQRVYLASLRCEDGRSPTYDRKGNVGHGVFGTIVDAYDVACPGSAPAAGVIYLDMYHPDHQETAAPPGFGFQPPRVLRLRVRRDGNGLLHADPNGPIEVRVLVADILR